MFQFANPEYLYALVLIPLFIVFYIFVRRSRRKAIKTFGEQNLMNRLMPEYSGARHTLKFTLLMWVMFLLILGIARPQFGSKLQEVKRKGIEMMIALDVSNSMMAQDIQPYRLERAKQIINQIINQIHSDKIGMVVFAGEAFVQIPITTDYSAVKMFLNTVNPEVIPRQGTAIGAAIDLSMSSFKKEDKTSKAIIIISDGENHEDNAVSSAEQALKNGIKVYTVGVGSPQGAPIPKTNQYGQNDYRTDNQGNVVVTKMDEVMLQQISSVGGGIYVRAANSNAGINTLLKELDKLTKTEMESRIYTEFDERFQYVIAIAFFLLLAEFLILERRNRLFRNFRLFSEGEDLISLGNKANNNLII